MQRISTYNIWSHFSCCSTPKTLLSLLVLKVWKSTPYLDQKKKKNYSRKATCWKFTFPTTASQVPCACFFGEEGFAVLEVPSSDILFSDLTVTNCNAQQMQQYSFGQQLHKYHICSFILLISTSFQSRCDGIIWNCGSPARPCTTIPCKSLLTWVLHLQDAGNTSEPSINVQNATKNTLH